ncbi:MAG: hypothetical protein KGJ34_00755 [Patescibacteria group bacterium]|nr:hypothetical protein [Patescibacteria group bacterium]
MLAIVPATDAYVSAIPTAAATGAKAPKEIATAAIVVIIEKMGLPKIPPLASAICKGTSASVSQRRKNQKDLFIFFMSLAACFQIL